MATPLKEKEKDKEKEKEKDKEGGLPKRKEREENFPAHEDDLPRTIVTRIVKAKVISTRINAFNTRSASPGNEHQQRGQGFPCSRRAHFHSLPCCNV